MEPDFNEDAAYCENCGEPFDADEGIWQDEAEVLVCPDCGEG